MPGTPDPSPAFGYLDCVEEPALGATGGYLIVSVTGRPLEFHCTAPVVASRAHEILFGATLRPHLLGEQIGATLVGRAAIRPALLIVSDRDLAIAAGETPLALALDSETAEPPRGWRAVGSGDGSSDGSGDGRGNGSGENRLWSPTPEAVAEPLGRLAASIDLLEPFERIREAVREAQRLSQQQPVSPIEAEGAPHRDAA